ncbi:UNVERIFIED_CONTAM: hypothetical protein Sradi_6957600 [Sesamum radiatum]|uniref:DUF4283 domain-containing protein n=1 Tax=Sesamum radiatum TaxID=300843 RepID=A0AAW2JHN8_SESRA
MVYHEMDSHEILSLSHNTHTDTYAQTRNPNSVVVDADGDDDDASVRVSDETIDGNIRQEFSFSDFYSLALRVLDGDSSSLEKLDSLKHQWEQRFSPPVEVLSRTRRLLPRFPSKVNFLPRQSIQLPVPAPAGQNSLPHNQDSQDPLPHNQESQDSPPERQSPAAPAETSSPPEIFVGNIKINMTRTDTIADGFLNSSWKTLRFIPPENQNDEIIIKPTIDMIERGSARWQATAVGYFLGKKPFFPQLEAFARANWKGLMHVSSTANGFFFFTFKTRAFMEEVMEEGPWLFQGQPVVLQAWEQGMSLRRHKHMQVPVWIRIRHLPMEYLTEDGLSAVASGVGVPLYTDKITKLCSRLDFARVCIMLDFHSKLPRHLVVVSPILKDGQAVPIKVDIEYEWLPLRCVQCCSLGHDRKSCPELQARKQSVPVSVFVRKKQSNTVDLPNPAGDDMADDLEAEGDHITSGPAISKVPSFSTTIPSNPAPMSGNSAGDGLESKGKEVIVYNPFAVLGEQGEYSDEIMESFHELGPKTSSPTQGTP